MVWPTARRNCCISRAVAADQLARDTRVYAVVKFDNTALVIRRAGRGHGLCVWRRLTSKHKGKHAIQNFNNCYSMIHKHCSRPGMGARIGGCCPPNYNIGWAPMYYAHPIFSRIYLRLLYFVLAFYCMFPHGLNLRVTTASSRSAGCPLTSKLPPVD